MFAGAQSPTVTLPPPHAVLADTFSDPVFGRELADGRMIFSDVRENRVVVGDFANGVVRTIGRQGRGPGEYSRAFRVFALRGDTSVMLDLGRRLTFLGDVIVGSAPLPSSLLTGFGTNVLGTSEAGEILVFASAQAGRAMGAADSSYLVLLSNGGTTRDTVGRLRPPPPEQLYAANPLFTESEQAVLAHDGWIAVLRVAPFRVDWRRPDGTWIRGAPLPNPAAPLTARERQFYLQRTASSRLRRGVTGYARWPENVPPFMIQWPPFATYDGKVVVRRTPTADRPGQVYDVVDRAGKLDRSVVLEPSERIIGFGRTVVYTVLERTDGGVQVRRHEWR